MVVIDKVAEHIIEVIDMVIDMAIVLVISMAIIRLEGDFGKLNKYLELIIAVM